MPAEPKHFSDKLPTSLLELHILSLLDRGSQTSYDFLQVGVSLGSSIPALRRMEAAGWVRAKRTAEIGKRQRHSFSLTAKGRRLMVRVGVSLLRQPPPVDFDAVLRVIDIADGTGAAVQEMLPFLKIAISDRLALAKQATRQSPDDRDQLQFKTTRTQWDGVRLRSEAGFLSRIAKMLASDSRQD